MHGPIVCPVNLHYIDHMQKWLPLNIQILFIFKIAPLTSFLRSNSKEFVILNEASEALLNMNKRIIIFKGCHVCIGSMFSVYYGVNVHRTWPIIADYNHYLLFEPWVTKWVILGPVRGADTPCTHRLTLRLKNSLKSILISIIFWKHIVIK